MLLEFTHEINAYDLLDNTLKSATEEPVPNNEVNVLN